MAAIDPDFPYSMQVCPSSIRSSFQGDIESNKLCRTISIPLPSHHLASSALRALQVDQELSPAVRRSFSLAKREPNPQTESTSPANGVVAETSGVDEEALTVLQTDYKATTNRMLRVAVNAFMDSLGVVLNVMEELDVDMLSTELGR